VDAVGALEASLMETRQQLESTCAALNQQVDGNPHHH